MFSCHSKKNPESLWKPLRADSVNYQLFSVRSTFMAGRNMARPARWRSPDWTRILALQASLA